MESGYKLWDEVLKTIGTLTSWPVVVLYLALLFRQALTRQIPKLFKSFEALVERLAKVKYKGIEAEFEVDSLHKTAAELGPELVGEAVLKIDVSAGGHDGSASVDE